jgi:hypothetical protein
MRSLVVIPAVSNYVVAPFLSSPRRKAGVHRVAARAFQDRQGIAKPKEFPSDGQMGLGLRRDDDLR